MPRAIELECAPEEHAELARSELVRSGTAAAASLPPSGSSPIAAYCNLLNTIVGGGILSLPFAFRSSGLAVGAAYQLIFGAASWYGSHLLLDTLRYQPLLRSYEALARASLGRHGALAYNVASLINCYGACVSYIIVTGDILPPLLHELGHDVSRSAVLVGVTVIIIFPLSCLRDITALQYSSALAIFIYLAFVCTMAYLGATADRDAAPREWPLLRPDPAGWIRAIPLCAFAFLHQTSLFPIYQEMKQPSAARMRGVLGASIASALVLYLVTALAAYARFGDAVRGDVLLNLGGIDSTCVRAVRLAFGVSVCLTYPCLHFAARRSLDQLLSGREGGAGAETPYRRLLWLTAGLVGSSLVVALLVDRVEVIFGFTGALASTAISYVLPAAISLMARPHRVASLRANGGTIGFLVSGALCGVVALANHAADVFT